MQTDPAKQKKSTLRKHLREKRAGLTQAYRIDCAKLVAESLAAQPMWKDLRSIGLYSAVNHELECSLIARAAWQAGKMVYLPCISGAELEFRLWGQNESLAEGAYGILEPSTEMPQTHSLDLLITPLLGWSTNGHRLGMGGGYYDRLLSANTMTIGVTLGLGFEAQRADEIDKCLQHWDRPLEGILTEAGFKRANQVG